MKGNWSCQDSTRSNLNMFRMPWTLFWAQYNIDGLAALSSTSLRHKLAQKSEVDYMELRNQRQLIQAFHRVCDQEAADLKAQHECQANRKASEC